MLGKLPFLTGEIIFIDSGDMVLATMFSALSFYQGHEITLHPSIKVGVVRLKPHTKQPVVPYKWGLTVMTRHCNT